MNQNRWIRYFLKLLPIILLLVLLSRGGVVYYSTKCILKNGISIEAIISEQRIGYRNEIRSFYFFYADEIKYTGYDDGGNWRVGEKLFVRFLPENPKENRSERYLREIQNDWFYK